MFDEAARTRARRHIAPALFKNAINRGSDLPEKPAPIPQELTTEFTEAYWQSLAWRQTTWIGKRVQRPPTDLFAYQDLIARLRPDWIIDVRCGGGGRAWFLASICDLVGNGRVIAIEKKVIEGRPQHDRIHYIAGAAVDDEVVEEVHRLVGEPANALVILGARAPARRISSEYRLYGDLVPLGGYLVIEDTIINGHPVWPNFGPGPAEAVKGIVEKRDEFVSDTELVNKYRLTFSPTGFLKRVR
jgi:cephalosporin hydroxylase